MQTRAGVTQFARRELRGPGLRVIAVEDENIAGAQAVVIGVSAGQQRFAALRGIGDVALVERHAGDIGFYDDAIGANRFENIGLVFLSDGVADANRAGGKRGEKKVVGLRTVENVRPGPDAQ